jgi:hypothetical protein
MADYSDWLPPVPGRLGGTGYAPESTPPKTLSPVSAGSLAKLLRGTAAGRGS